MEGQPNNSKAGAKGGRAGQPGQKSGQSNDVKMSQDARTALKRFELENEIIEEEKLYHFDEAEVDQLFKDRPWKKDQKHFKKVKISAPALIKMVMHAKSGGDIEVMGMMQGKVRGDTFYVMDAFALPVDASETRVNAAGDANEYLVAHVNASEEVHRPENLVGWYHSHPGYGCWLSGIDVGTQSLYQGSQEPFLAVVVDPKRTMSAGKVEIGAFRCYSAAEIVSIEAKMKEGGGSQADTSVPMEKIKELGAHYHKYYQLETSYFKSSVDSEILDRLWNEYWLATLSASPLLNNQREITRQVCDITQKMQQANSQAGNAISSGGGATSMGPSGGQMQGFGRKRGKGHGGMSKMMRDIGGGMGGGDMSMGFGGAGGAGISAGSGLSSKVMDQVAAVEKESTQTACGCDHGLMVEALKKFMFTSAEQQ